MDAPAYEKKWYTTIAAHKAAWQRQTRANLFLHQLIRRAMRLPLAHARRGYECHRELVPCVFAQVNVHQERLVCLRVQEATRPRVAVSINSPPHLGASITRYGHLLCVGRCYQRPRQHRLSFRNNCASMAGVSADHRHPQVSIYAHIWSVYPPLTIVLMLKPNVGLTVLIGSPIRRCNVVVLPALSRPRKRMRNSFSLSGQ